MRFLVLICAIIPSMALCGNLPITDYVKVLNLPPTVSSGGIAIVQVAKATTSTFTPVSAEVSISPTAGNVLVAVMASQSDDFTTVSNNIASGTTGWTKVTSTNTSAGNARWVSVWYCVAPSGVTAVRAWVTSQGGYITLIVHEVSGLAASPFTSGEAVKAATGSTASPSTTALNNATANSIYFAGWSSSAGGNPVQMDLNNTGTTGTWAYFDSTNSKEQDGNNVTVLSVPYLIVSSSASRAHVWTTPNTFPSMVSACFHQ